MKYLIDTNVISELAKPEPNPRVVEWFSKVANSSLFISVLTIGEIRNGIESLAPGKKKTKLLLWLEQDLLTWFGHNILPVSLEVAECWGFINARIKKYLPAIDTLIAATAVTHDLRVVTRNETDFYLPDVEVINPFK
jgi:predicted nucleic acid-binding protein